MENEINFLLDNIEENYFIFDDLLDFEPDDFISDADKILDLNTIPILEVPLTLLEMLGD